MKENQSERAEHKTGDKSRRDREREYTGGSRTVVAADGLAGKDSAADA